MRRAWILALALPLLAVLGLAVRAATVRPALAFTTGVKPQLVVATLAPGRRVCQGPIEVAASFDRIAVALGRPGGGGPPLGVTVAGGGAVARGAIAGGYSGAQVHAVARVPRVARGRRVSVCLVDRGRVSVAVLGGAAGAAPLSHGTLSGRPLDGDIVLDFRRSRPPTLLGEAGAIVRRATLFHPGFVVPWTLWALLILLVAGMPVLLVVALRRAIAPESTDESGRAGLSD